MCVKSFCKLYSDVQNIILYLLIYDMIYLFNTPTCTCVTNNTYTVPERNNISKICDI